MERNRLSQHNISEHEVEAIFDDVLQERIRQKIKWGTQYHEPVIWSAILAEEVGEVAEASLDLHFGTPSDPESDKKKYREEIIQVIAVGFAMLECLNRDG